MHLDDGGRGAGQGGKVEDKAGAAWGSSSHDPPPLLLLAHNWSGGTRSGVLVVQTYLGQVWSCKVAEVDKVGRNLGLVGLMTARHIPGAVSGRGRFAESVVV